MLMKACRACPSSGGQCWIMQLMLSVIFAGLLLQSAGTDIVHRRIPNAIVSLIVLLWPLQALTLEPTVAFLALPIALAVLVVGILVWTAGWFGAGDVKLLAGVALWAGHEHVASTFLVIVAAGAAIAVALLTIRFWEALLPSFARPSGGAKLDRLTTSPARHASRSVPYGVAIAAGGLWLAGRLIAG